MSQPLTIESALQYLKQRFNVERDEVEALGHRSDDEIIKFCSNAMRGVSDGADDEDDQTPEPEDKYKPSAKQLKKVAKIAPQQAKEDLKKLGKVAADLSHLPPEQRVTTEEAENELARLLGKPLPHTENVGEIFRPKKRVKKI